VTRQQRTGKPLNKTTVSFSLLDIINSTIINNERHVQIIVMIEKYLQHHRHTLKIWNEDGRGFIGASFERGLWGSGVWTAQSRRESRPKS
jgi:hypothetical protein